MSKPDLSLVILNYKMDGLVKNCLKSIYEHSHEKELEVIVVDNDSRDACESIVKEQFPQVKFIQSGKNYGHAKGNNLGIKEASGRYVMILNPDIVFLEPVFDRLIDFLDATPAIGMATMQLKNPDGTLQPGAWNFHRLLTPIYQRIPMMKKMSSAKQHLDEFVMHDWDRTTSREVDWVQGSCLVVRDAALEEIGLLDERFFLYFTDVDWCRRCWDSGWKVYYYADANVIHYYHRESASSFGVKSLLNKTTRIHIRDWFKYLHKYKGKQFSRSL